MSRPSRLLATALAVPVLWTMGLQAARPALAQAAAPLEVTNVDTSAAPEVSLVVTAPSSAFGVDLADGGISVAEGGAARPVTVERLPGDELEVVLVLDTSGSMAGPAMAAAKAAAASFLDRLPPTTPVAVIGFGASASLAHPSSTDRAAAHAALAGLDARGETALYDALDLALGLPDTGPNRARAVVLLSDGGDTTSTLTIADVAGRLATGRATLHAIELSSEESNSAALRELTAAGHGTLALADDPGALTSIYDAMATRLTSQYRVRFTTEGHGATPVTVALHHGDVRHETTLTLELPAAPPTTAAPAPAPSLPPASAAPSPPPTTAPLASDTDGPAVPTWLLAAGAACAFAALVLLLLPVLVTERRRARERLGVAPRPSPASGQLSSLAARAAEAAEGVLDRKGRRLALGAMLEQAGVALRPGEFVVLVASSAVAALVLGHLLVGPLFGLVAAGATLLIARLVLDQRTTRRRRAFGDQLGDALGLMAGSLRAGYGLLQAVDTVAREAEEPTSAEFRRVVIESRLGRDLIASLQAMGERLRSEDLDNVVQAVEIHREVGGDLAEVLDTVAATIRERRQLQRQVKALSAEGRLSAYVLLALPFVVGGLIHLTNPGYMDEMASAPGYVMFGVGGALMALGAAWLRKLCRLVY